MNAHTQCCYCEAERGVKRRRRRTITIPCVAGASRAELRRRKITDAARKLFIANGFHATGIAQIARESGVAVGQIYRDFAAKEEIVAALIHTDCAKLLHFESLDLAIRQDDSAAVQGWIRDFIAPISMDDSRMFAEIVAESARNSRMAGIYKGVQDDLRAHILAALALVAPGEASDRRRAGVADVLITVSLGLMQYQLMQPDMERAEIVGTLAALIEAQVDALKKEAIAR